MSVARAAAPGVLTRASALVGPALDKALERLDPSLHDAVRHHLGGGGKHVRAALVLLAATAVGGREEDAVCGAIALELVHNYSLLHDDIIDGDRERRHRPTVWAQFGEGIAIVAGDALAALAMQLLLDEPSASHVLAVARLAGANQAMIAGQAADMAFEQRTSVTVDECLSMERAKTGALLGAAAAVGSLLGGARDEAVEALGDYGEHLGVAFQAVDDMLGVWGDPAVTGKPVGSDLLARKKTLPVAVAMSSGGSAAVELEAILSAELDRAAVERASRILEESGARDAVAAIAEDHLKQSLGALERVALVDEAKEELVAVAYYVTSRDR